MRTVTARAAIKSFPEHECTAQDDSGPIAVPPKPNFQRARRSSSFNVARFRQCVHTPGVSGSTLGPLQNCCPRLTCHWTTSARQTTLLRPWQPLAS